MRATKGNESDTSCDKRKKRKKRQRYKNGRLLFGKPVQVEEGREKSVWGGEVNRVCFTHLDKVCTLFLTFIFWFSRSTPVGKIGS
mmetsp:Transcript_25675/g.64561  ORF Transcript_25675/g.64561 Transcript_25675/m.64561 type:complete len:85 (-) Transcript_25675:320-574(-)